MAGSGLFISLFRQRIGPLFVDDLDVTTEVAKVAPICAGYQIFDGIAGTSSGVLRYNSCIQSFHPCPTQVFPRVPQDQVCRIQFVLEAPHWSGLMLNDALHGAWCK